jgi:hypothetical protein
MECTRRSAVKSIQTFEAFRNTVGSPLAARVSGEVFPFRWPEPSLRDVLAQAREEPQARICTGTRGEALSQSLQEHADAFRALPLEEALVSPVHLSLFDLGRLRQPGGALYEAIAQVYLPLIRLWAQEGLYWQRVYPILFLSGPGCSTNYHWDPSSVLFVQLGGCKQFHALEEPRRWLPQDRAEISHTQMVRPAQLRTEDVRTFAVGPGEAIWSPCLAPHWVDAGDQPAFSLSIAFTDIGTEPSPDRKREAL